MVKARIFLAVLFLLAAIGWACSYAAAGRGVKNKNMPQKSGTLGFALVELFTSEGCSSCPPADEAVAQLVKGGQKNVFVLGFHVDYWDDLGWKDAFSNAAFSARQQQYGNAFRLNSVYTPQAIVNGKTQFTGSDTKLLNATVADALAIQPGNTLELAAKKGIGETVTIDFSIGKPENTNTLNIALVQLNAKSNVKRGENSGRVLTHVNVVRGFKTFAVPGATGQITLAIPAGLAADGCKIIAFTQNAALQVTAAAEAAIQ